VRATGPFSKKLLAAAIAHSPTVADLVQRLERSDVFVYVEVATIDIPTAKTVLLATPGPYRYLLVSINYGQSPEQRAILLGHELQHAVEISEAPEVRDSGTLRALYRRIGWSAGAADKFETYLAQATGARVKRDIQSKLSAF
jgi:hypothetical protein